MYCLLDVTVETLWETVLHLALWTYRQSLVLHMLQAATYGCGCWATNGTDRVPAIAACTSGCGEYLVRTMLAREAAVEVQKSECPVTALHSAMKTKFLGEASKCEILILNIRSMISK
jgi:isoaspartyl peptidase/L-asparaginase-like protein (Ntn-hydrolase superfamily)